MQNDVLFVDDDPSMRDMFHAVFEMWGITYDIASSAYEALYKLENKSKYRLIITDINMPGKDGIDFAVELSALGVTAPLIALTGNGGCLRGKEYLFSSIHQKPVRLETFKDSIDKWLNVSAPVA